jgi:hypothetical protein
MAGLVLGVALTLGMNAGAGWAHGPLDAVVLGMVPVVFFIAVEVVLWHVRRGRGALVPAAPPEGSPVTSPGTVPSSNIEAAKARMAQAVELGFRYSDNQAQADFGLTRAEAAKARRELIESRLVPYQIPGREAAPLMDTPAGVADPRSSPPAPAGASLNGAAHG